MILSAAIEEAQAYDAASISLIHLDARRQAMPWLRSAHTDDETRDYFARVVGRPRRAWWVVRDQGQVAAYMLIDEQDIDHLYVAPSRQGQGFGSALLAHAKALSPRLLLWTFQRNTRARAFYETHGFLSVRQTCGENEEGEPDVQYEWMAV